VVNSGFTANGDFSSPLLGLPGRDQSTPGIKRSISTMGEFSGAGREQSKGGGGWGIGGG